MAKDKSTDPERKEKKEKKEKKRKHEEVEEIAAPSTSSSKKDKKEKKRKSTDGTAVAVVAEDADMTDLVVKPEDDDEKVKVLVPAYKLEALVPFANPLCDDKALKKVLKSVKKGAKTKALKRGVKECVKAIRKSPVAPASALNASSSDLSHGIVVLAADISPLDVISHIPVLCEDHNIPYVYVPSRAELGAAGATKRPTSVVMLTQRSGGAAGKKAVEDEDAGEWEEAYKDLHKLAVKMAQTVKV